MTEREKNIKNRVWEHYEEAKEYFPRSRIIGIFLQGSQNYGLDYEASDVDTKLIITPTFKDIAFNKKPVSTTHIRENEEHIDFKDIRLYIETFRKQNINFLEILFTDYKLIQDIYAFEWERLVDNREAIAHYNLFQAVKAMKGVALEKFHAMEHPYPSKLEILAKYGYDPKQVSHLVRIEDFLGRYIHGESYEECLYPKWAEFIMNIKLGFYDLEQARDIAKKSLARIEQMADAFTDKVENKGDPLVDDLLNDVQYNIMEQAIRLELKE